MFSIRSFTLAAMRRPLHAIGGELERRAFGGAQARIA